MQGGAGKSAAELLLLQSEYQRVGFIDTAYPEVADVLGIPVLGKVTAEALQLLKEKVDNLVVAFGNNDLPAKIIKLIFGFGFNMLRNVYPHTFVSSRPKLGKGYVIMANVVIRTKHDYGASVPMPEIKILKLGVSQ